jgi:ABC-type glycerol-3-phosphate transport system substrate-binding protein
MVHAQGTGGTLRCGWWDHWVPVGNNIMRELCKEWGDRNRVEVQMDFITSVGNQNLLTIAAQAQSRSGHDILAFPTWEPSAHARLLEPVDDVIGRLVQKYGPIAPAAEYLGKREGAWRGVPAVSGTQCKPSLVRFDLLKQHAGIDIQEMWPARAERGPGADTWNWETFITAAEKCHAAGVPFGLPMGQFTDAVDWVGSLFRSYGAALIDERGNVTVRNNPKVRQVMELAVRLSKSLPGDVWAWDDASNNRHLISGRGALVFNPPSAWAVAKRDNPQVAEKCWQAPFPAGPEGRFTRTCPTSGASGRSAARSPPPRRCSNSCPSARSGAADHDEQRLRRTALPEHVRLQGVGHGRAAHRRGVQLPEQAAPPGAAQRRLRAGAGGDRGAGLQPGDQHQDDRPRVAGRREHRPVPGLGGARAAQLRARLTVH